MKRFVVPLLALFAITLPMTAHAGHWVQKEVGWAVGGGNVYGTVTVHDTTFAKYPLKTSLTPDTTAKFSLSNADVWRTAHAGAATTVDTVVVGHLLIVQDSTGAVRPTISSITAEIDGRVGAYRYSAGDTLAVGWNQIDSLAVTYVNNFPYNQIIDIPLRAVNGLGGSQPGGNGPENFLSMPYRLTSFEDLRVRITAVTGIMSGNLRCFIRYWDSDPDTGPSRN